MRLAGWHAGPSGGDLIVVCGVHLVLAWVLHFSLPERSRDVFEIGAGVINLASMKGLFSSVRLGSPSSLYRRQARQSPFLKSGLYEPTENSFTLGPVSRGKDAGPKAGPSLHMPQVPRG